MKIAAIVRSYYLTDFLPAVLKQFSDIDKILVVNNVFSSVTKPVKDDTETIVKRFGNAELYRSEETEQHKIFNECLAKLYDYTAVFICDADELYLQHDLKKLFDLIVDKNFDGVFVRVLDYVSTEMKEVYKIRKHTPIAILKPNLSQFYTTRCVRIGNATVSRDTWIYHLGFCYKDDKMKWKINNYWGKNKQLEALEILNSKKLSIQTPFEIKEKVYACLETTN